MEDKAIKVLLIEDNPDDAELLKRQLARSQNGHFAVTTVTTLKEGLKLLAWDDGIDLVLTDLSLPDSHGLDTITRVIYQSKHTPVVVLSGLDDEALAIKAVHMGAQDYLVKGQMEGRQLERALFYAIERSRLQSELEQYTQEVGKSRDNLRKIMEKNADAIVVVSHDRHMRFVNPAAESLLGRRKKELIGKPFGFPLEAGERTEIDIIHPGGETSVAEMRVADIDWEGKPAYLASLRDVTEHKKTEIALRFSDAAFRSINESVIATDLDYAITHWNEVSERIYGISAAEATGKKILDVIEIAEIQPGENAGRFSKLENSGHYQEEQLHRTKYGEVWVDVHIQAIEDDSQRYGWVILATVITQRKHAEEALKQSEEFSSSLLQNAPNPIAVINPDTSVKFINPAFERLLGFSQAEIIGSKAPYPWWPEEAREERQAALKEALTGASNTIEATNRKKNGELFWAVINSVPVTSHGKLRYLLVNWVDTTERKQAEEKLRESEERYRELFDNANDLIQSVTPDGHFTYVNKAWREALGYSEEEVANLTIWDIIHPDAIPHCKEIFQRAIAGEKINHIETVFVTKDGRAIQIEGNATSYAKEGKILATRGIFRDTTERKQAEQSIKRAAEEWRITFDSINDWVSIHDTDFKFIRVNKSLASAFKKNPKEIIGKHCYQFLHGGTQPIPDCPHIKALRTKKPAKAELELPDPGIYAEISVSPIFDDAGNVVATVHITKDITQRKRAEEKMRQIDKMKSEFLSNVSHELRTPLQSISGFIKLLRRGQVPDKETRQEFLEIIDRESQYLGNLINSLLDMSRLESGRFEINKRPGPIRDTIVDAVRIFEGLARDKEITLTEDIPENLPEIEADSERLRQVVINLVGNAIKFSDPGGSVTVKAERRNRELLFQIIDRGIGIPEEAMKHLFERFYRAEDKMVRGGAGLGLYISKQIVEAHGGRIWAESQADKGSTFSFTLPLNGKGGKTHERENPGH
jgi:PAS domain S-box-containing protein